MRVSGLTTEISLPTIPDGAATILDGALIIMGVGCGRDRFFRAGTTSSVDVDDDAAAVPDDDDAGAVKSRDALLFSASIEVLHIPLTFASSMGSQRSKHHVPGTMLFHLTHCTQNEWKATSHGSKMY